MKRQRERSYVIIFSNDMDGENPIFGGSYPSMEEAKAEAQNLNLFLESEMKEYHDEECPNLDCWPIKEQQAICRCKNRMCKNNHAEDFNEDLRCLGIPKMAELPSRLIGKPHARMNQDYDHEEHANFTGEEKRVFEHMSLTYPLKAVYIPQGKRDEIENFKCEWLAIMEV